MSARGKAAATQAHTTASAAGLLTQFDSASYAVTKHAVVALSDRAVHAGVAVTYRRRGRYQPLYFAEAVLADGRLAIIGGEYNHNSFSFTNLGAVYDPTANTWTALGHPKGGTQGVGRATTQAVVVASIWIFFVTFIIDKIFVNL